MPENSPLKPSDVQLVRSLTKKTSDLAFLTVTLVNEGEAEDAKRTAALCSEDLDILRVLMGEFSPTEAAAIAREVRRQNQADAEARIQ